MDENAEVQSVLARARKALRAGVPLAPYWEGRTLEEALVTSVRELRSEPDRAALYERLLTLLDAEDAMIQDQALVCLFRAFRAEQWEETEEQPTDRVSTQLRLARMLAGVEQRLPNQPELLEAFCSHFSPNLCDPPEIEAIRDWLKRLAEAEEHCPVPEVTLLAARIFFGAYGATWKEAGDALLAALDHPDLSVRACAAYQIGTLCRRLAQDDPDDFDDRDIDADRDATEGMAPLEEYWALIRRKEIERAGVGGAFWNSAPRWTIDRDVWILTLLEQAEPEPYLRYFPCNLQFDAHERYSDDPAAVRRLMDAGRTDIAMAAAADANYPVPGMEPLLMELGDITDPDFVRLASWTLAYYYRFLHPAGERLGFVQRHTTRPDCDLFLLFSKPEERDTPYAVVLYPRLPRQHWSRKEAEALVKRVFPYRVRGRVRADDFPGPDQTWYRSGYVNFAVTTHEVDAPFVTRITIGYRSDVPWNPLQS